MSTQRTLKKFSFITGTVTAAVKTMAALEKAGCEFFCPCPPLPHPALKCAIGLNYHKILKGGLWLPPSVALMEQQM